MSEERPLETLETRRIARPVRCGTCRYELKGLALGGKCPECGTPIWETVLAIADPAARGLPQLHSPRAVGSALVLFVAGLLLATLSIAVPSAAEAIDLVRTAPRWMSHAIWRDLGPAVLILAGIAVPVMLWPRHGDDDNRRVKNHLRLMAACLLIAAAGLLWARPGFAGARLGRLGEGWSGPALHLLVVVPLAVALLGYRRILVAVGDRSRQFRTAGGDRQRILDLVAAAGILALGEAVRILGHGTTVSDLGGVIAGVSACMIIIGLVYLLVNTTWVRRALVSPPPSVRELIGDAEH